MAGKNQVTLTFAGDESKLTQSFDRVGESARKMQGDVDGASNKLRDSGESFDKAAEGADRAEQRAQGFNDTLTGVQDTMGGVSQIASGDLAGGFLTLGQGVADLASGFANLLIPLGKTAILKAFAAGQWLINAAMSANPIGLVVLAVAALVVGIVIAWKKSETFRNIVTGAWNAIWGLVKKVGAWFKDTLWPWLKGVFDKIGNAVGTVKDWITRKFGEAVDWLKGLPGKVWGAIKNTWSNFNNGVAVVKDWIVRKFGEVVTFLKGLPGKISKAASGMFDGIKNAFRSALNWLIDRWNGLSFSIPSIDTHIPGVGTIGGFSLGTPDIPRFHSGGIVPGGLGSESLAVLRAGERVTASSNSGGAATIVIKSDGTQLGNLLIEVLKKSIRVQGGDVQVVLGS